jgi:hypothetical protein
MEYTGAQLKELGDDPRRTCSGIWSEKHCAMQNVVGTCKGPYRTKLFYVVPDHANGFWDEQARQCKALSKNAWLPGQ